MATRAFDHEGFAFVTNNYAAALNKNYVDESFHFIQDFLRLGDIGYAFTQSLEVYGRAVMHIWREAIY